MLAAVAMDLADVSEMPFKLARGPPRCTGCKEVGRAGEGEKEVEGVQDF